MKRDRVSMEILSVLKESTDNKNNKKVLTEMPQKFVNKKTIKGYDFNELNNYAKSKVLNGREEPNSKKDALDRFNQDAKLDLNNKIQQIIPGVFEVKYGSRANYEDKNDIFDNLGLEIKYKTFLDYIASKFPNLEINKDSYGYRNGDDYFSVEYRKGQYNDISGDEELHKLRRILRNSSNFDELRRQDKTAINNFLDEVRKAIVQATIENKSDFESRRNEYDKYIRTADKELEDELNKYWYDNNGNIIKAKNIDESFIQEYGLKEAVDLDVEDYIEIFDFDELSDYVKGDMTSRKINSKIQKMGDRMTEILGELLAEYMGKRGLTLDPDSFNVSDILYGMTHKNSGSNRYYWGSSPDTSIKLTKNALKSYFENNQDLVEKYGQDMIDKLFDYTDENKSEYTKGSPVFYLKLYGDKAIVNFPWSLKNNDNNYREGASKEFDDMVRDLNKELSLDFYSAYKLLDKAKTQLRNEAREEVYEKIRKAGKKYDNKGNEYSKEYINSLNNQDEENKAE